MGKEIDIVLVNPGDRKQVYQALSKDLTASEPPYLVASMATYLRSKKINVMVIDSNAEMLTPSEIARRVTDIDPLLSLVVVYGAQPSASTQNMTIAGKICTALKMNTSSFVAIGGLHPSALPRKTIEEETVDFVIEGEGPITVMNLLETLKKKSGDYSSIPGLWYRKDGVIKHNQRVPLVPNLDEILPAAAWDMLPMKKYRAHNWHCLDDIDNRMPYGAIYTSLGCPYSCVFCCINTPFGKPGIRYKNPESVVEEIGLLVNNYGIKHLKIIDELFVFREKHYMAIVDLLVRKGFDLNIWAYARVDTVKTENLRKMKKAGINWLALGIESANSGVRDKASKMMKIKDIKSVIESIRKAGINIMGNYIFGLPDDDISTMKETLDMALDLNCEFANFYCAMAYPGSRLYDMAVENDWQLPKEWHHFSQHSYETIPLPTKHISAREVLRFRDDAFHEYFGNQTYLDMLENRFGTKAKDHVQEMTNTRLKRKLLEG